MVDGASSPATTLRRSPSRRTGSTSATWETARRRRRRRPLHDVGAAGAGHGHDDDPEPPGRRRRSLGLPVAGESTVAFGRVPRDRPAEPAARDHRPGPAHQRARRPTPGHPGHPTLRGSRADRGLRPAGDRDRGDPARLAWRGRQLHDPGLGVQRARPVPTRTSSSSARRRPPGGGCVPARPTPPTVGSILPSGLAGRHRDAAAGERGAPDRRLPGGRGERCSQTWPPSRRTRRSTASSSPSTPHPLSTQRVPGVGQPAVFGRRRERRGEPHQRRGRRARAAGFDRARGAAEHRGRRWRRPDPDGTGARRHHEVQRVDLRRRRPDRGRQPGCRPRRTRCRPRSANHNILTDDPYGDFDPIAWKDRALYVPDVALGRLVESGAEIAAQLRGVPAGAGDGRSDRARRARSPRATTSSPTRRTRSTPRSASRSASRARLHPATPW